MTAAPATVLTVNAGSSSIRLGLFQGTAQSVSRVRSLRAGGDVAAAPVLESFVDGARVDAVAHRIVHGGPRLGRTCALGARTVEEIERAAPLAPLHNPRALAWARTAGQSLPDAAAVAVFDHGFFASLPPEASTYALPATLRERLGLRRLGFHGLAHQSMWETFAALAPQASRVISFQLGSGCSAAALRDGAPVDTSMGFTPLGGLVMGSRPGDLDPGVLLHLLRDAAMSPRELERVLTEQSGLVGLSGGTSSVQALLSAATPEAEQALAVFCHSARKTLGAYLAVLGGCDAVLLGGGVGENAPRVRAMILDGLHGLGLRLDAAANATAAPPARITTPDSSIAAWVVPTDEETILAREALTWLDGRPR